MHRLYFAFKVLPCTWKQDWNLRQDCCISTNFWEDHASRKGLYFLQWIVYCILGCIEQKLVVFPGLLGVFYLWMAYCSFLYEWCLTNGRENGSIWESCCRFQLYIGLTGLVHLRLVFPTDSAWLHKILFLSTDKIIQWKFESWKWAYLFKGIPWFLQDMLYVRHARAAKKNKLIFYSVMSLSKGNSILL